MEREARAQSTPTGVIWLVTWVPVDSTDPDCLMAVMDERFYLFTWPFGTIHQLKVIIRYEHAGWHSDHFMNVPGNAVDICLAPGKTLEEAQMRGLQWVIDYQCDGTPGPEVVVAKALKDWPDLYADREAVLDQLFFVGGNGYRWLDGALIETTQEPPPDFSHQKQVIEDYERIEKEVRALAAEHGIEMPPEHHKSEPKKPLFKLWGDHVNLMERPADIRPEWAGLTLEAAALLKEKGQTEQDREAGAKVAAELNAG